MLYIIHNLKITNSHHSQSKVYQ